MLHICHTYNVAYEYVALCSLGCLLYMHTNIHHRYKESG